MVYRYQALLQDDEVLRRKLQYLCPERRTILIAAMIFACTIPFLIAALDRTTPFLLIILGCAGTLLLAAKLSQEHRIIRSWSCAVGTVFAWRRINLGRRPRAQIRYAFRACDDRIYVGKTSGSLRLPRESKTLGILYNSGDPERNMPISQFWFYELDSKSTNQLGDPNVVRK